MCGPGCAEFDILEANSKAARVTAHICDSETSCDSDGCGVAVEGFGKGSSLIDTARPFVVELDFTTSSSEGIAMSTTTFRQCGTSTTILHDDDKCGSGYMTQIASTKDAMVVAVSSWGDLEVQMAWLDGDVCSGNAVCNYGSWSISNFELRERGLFEKSSDDDVGCHSSDDGEGEDDTFGFGWGIPLWYFAVAIAIIFLVLLGCVIKWAFKCSFRCACLSIRCACCSARKLLEKIGNFISFVLCCQYFNKNNNDITGQRRNNTKKKRKKKTTKNTDSHLKTPLI